MIRYWLKALPPIYHITFFCAFFALTYSMNFLFWLNGLDWSGEDRLASMRMSLLAAASGLLAVYRVTSFCPAYDKRYMEWLAIAPWSSKLGLPKGPMRITPVDAGIMAVIALLAYINAPALTAVPVTVFLGVYTVLLGFALMPGHDAGAGAVLLFAPFTVYPFADWNIAAGVLLVLYLVCHVSAGRWLEGFPWNSRFWNDRDSGKEFKEHAKRMRLVGWPYKFLGWEQDRAIKVGEAMGIALLFTWWFHAGYWLFGRPEITSLIVPFTVALAVIRLGIYKAGGIYRAPISLLGRVFTGKIMIPGYDQIFIGPIIVLITGLLLPWILGQAGASSTVILEGSVFAILFLTFAIGPGLGKWRLTGTYSINVTMSAMRQKAPAEPDKIVEMFQTSLRK